MKTNTRKVSIPMQTRLAAVQPKTLNKEARTVEVVFTTGSRGRRTPFFDEPFFEELGLKKSEVRMGRLNNKAPFLDTHGFGENQGVRSVIGVVEHAELIPEREGRALVRFSKRDAVEDIFRDVEDGILTHVSVGYNVHKFKEVGEQDGLKIMRAVDWEPAELSLVPAGFDDNATVRSKENCNDCEIVENKIENVIINETEIADKSRSQKTEVAKPEKLRETNPTGEITMTEKEKEQAKKDAATELRKEITDEVTLAEKNRSKEIRSIVSKVGLKAELADTYIDENKTLDEVRTLVINTIAEKDKDPATQTRATNQTVVGEDLSRKGRVEGMTSAILHRFRPEDEETVQDGKRVKMTGYKIIESGRDYAYLSLIDMARICLESSGVRTGSIPKHRIAEMALSRGLNSTSDFPEILANVVNKTLRNGYLAAPQTFQAFTREVFVNDFKEISRTNLGDAAKLLKLEEGSEVKRSTISEAAEKYNVEEFARIITLTRKVIINDDLDAMTRLPERMGRRAADLESDTVWDIIKANAALADATALFAAGHGNLSTSPAAPSEAGLSEARKLMRRQLGLDGAEISLTPVWIFVPPEHETTAEKLIASIVPDSSTNVSPFSSAGRTPLRLDVEPRLETGADGSVTAWYVTADKGQVDMVELARLSGSNGPQTMTREGFDVHGVEIKIMHDIGAKAIDFVGLFKNAGA